MLKLISKKRNELGYLSFWKDKSKGKEFVRPVIKTTRGMEDVTVVLARAFYPDEDLTDKKIFFLDGDKTNFNPENICIVPSTVFNQLLNNNLLSDNVKANKLAVQALLLNELIKNKQSSMKGGDVNGSK